jgi:hypothetical protein
VRSKFASSLTICCSLRSTHGPLALGWMLDVSRSIGEEGACALFVGSSPRVTNTLEQGRNFRGFGNSDIPFDELSNSSIRTKKSLHNIVLKM